MSSEPKPFNPWPVGIIAFFALFISVMGGLIVFISSRPMDLVAPDYYEQEIRYQSQMDRRDRTREVAAQIRVTHDAAGQRLIIALPAAHARRPCEGRIHLYRPSAAGLDRHEKLALDALGQQSLDARDLQPGLWKVRIHWTVEGEEFYTDQSIVVPPPVS
jgi:nitrogen fixation protein FixH